MIPHETKRVASSDADGRVVAGREPVLLTVTLEDAEALSPLGFLAQIVVVRSDGWPCRKSLRPVIGHPLFLWSSKDSDQELIGRVAETLIRLDGKPYIITAPCAAADFVAGGATANDVRALIDLAEEWKVNAPVRQPIENPLELELNDDANARRFIRLHGQDVRFVSGIGWHTWTGTHWMADELGAVMELARTVPQAILDEITTLADLPALRAFKQESDKVAFIARYAQTSGNEPQLRRCLELASTDKQIAVLPSHMDSDPWLLNCVNGTIDLRTGTLRPHDRADLITKLSPVAYDHEARSDRWDKFLDVTTNGNLELRGFLQRAAGYTATGLTGREHLVLIHGPAGTGKSTFLEAKRTALGSYAKTANFETFVKKRDGQTGPSEDIARLAGARFVASIEVEEGKTLAEALVKSLTGGETITARHLYKASFEFTPRFVLWLACNHAPRVSDRDSGMWRRILLVPFEHQVPKEQQDPELKRALVDPKRDGPAVLAWIVQGCIEWQRQGLAVPDAVLRATEGYQREQDPLAEFFAECVAFEKDSWTATAQLRLSFETWSGEKLIMHDRQLAERMQKKGCVKSTRKRLGPRQRGWSGCRLISADDPDPRPRDTDAHIDTPFPETFRTARAHETVYGNGVSIRASVSLQNAEREAPL